MIDHKYLHEIFEYRDGHLYWKIKSNRNTKIGDKAGSIGAAGYNQITFKRKTYQGHRLIFLYHHGYFPKYIDHINRNKLDNRIENLRPINKKLNSANSAAHYDSTSKYKGVYFCKRENKWRACLRSNKKNLHLGSFHCEIKAAKAYDKKAKEEFGEYAYLNFESE